MIAFARHSQGGVLAAITTPSTDLVAALLLAQGGLIALGLILIDEVDNAYGDLYSGSVAGHSLEPFLLMLSSVFIPLYS